MKDEYDFSKGRRGPMAPSAPGQTHITLPLDDEVLDWFRARVHELGGGNYLTLINDALRQHILAEPAPSEDTLCGAFGEDVQRAA